MVTGTGTGLRGGGPPEGTDRRGREGQPNFIPSEIFCPARNGKVNPFFWKKWEPARAKKRWKRLKPKSSSYVLSREWCGNNGKGTDENAMGKKKKEAENLCRL